MGSMILVYSAIGFQIGFVFEPLVATVSLVVLSSNWVPPWREVVKRRTVEDSWSNMGNYLHEGSVWAIN